MNIIPIGPPTLDIIEVLNNGVRPKEEETITFFIYHTDKPAEIINHEELERRYTDYGAIVKIMYLK